MEVAHFVDGDGIVAYFMRELPAASPAVVEIARRVDEGTYEFEGGGRVVRLRIDDDRDPDTVLCSVTDDAMVFDSVAYPSMWADVDFAVSKAVTWLG